MPLLTCPRCAYRLDDHMVVCPECGDPRPSGPQPPGMPMIQVASLILWPTAVIFILAMLAALGIGIIAAPAILLLAIVNVINGPVMLMVIRDRHVAPEGRTRWPIGDLRRHRPAAAVLVTVLLGLVWALPILAVGTCLVVALASLPHT